MSVNNGENSENHIRLASVDSTESYSQSSRKPSFPRNCSFADMSTQAEAKVLVIYTGGTIGMTRNSNNGMHFKRKKKNNYLNLTFCFIAT